MSMYFVLIIGILLLSVFVQWRFKSKFGQYAEMQLRSGMSGAEVALKMLADHGIYDVKVI